MINHYNGDTNDTYHGWSSNSATEVVKAFSETNPVLIVLGYVLMLVYCAFAFSRFDWVRSHAGAGMVRGKEESGGRVEGREGGRGRERERKDRRKEGEGKGRLRHH